MTHWAVYFFAVIGSSLALGLLLGMALLALEGRMRRRRAR